MSSGARLLELARNADGRGELRVGELPTSMPFPAVRFFVVDGVPAGTSRGDHAHRRCHQLLVCLRGRIHVTTTSSLGTAAFTLEPGTAALHIPPLVWATQRYAGPDTQLLVLASEAYSDDEYIRDRREFADLAGIEVHPPDA